MKPERTMQILQKLEAIHRQRPALAMSDITNAELVEAPQIASGAVLALVDLAKEVVAEKPRACRLVYICSPCRGDYEKNLANARRYCRQVMELMPDAIPVAPHLYFTQFLDDTVEDERDRGLSAGIDLLDMCDEIILFGEPSEGMSREIQYAKEHAIPIRDAAEIFKSKEETKNEN